MKKVIPFIVSGVLMVGAVACQQDTSKTSDAGTANDTPVTTVKEATSKTANNTKTVASKPTTNTKLNEGTKTSTNAGGVKTIVKNRLEEKFPGSKLSVEEKDGVLIVKGTVPDEATLKKIEPTVKEYKFQGVKNVKVEAKVAGKKV
ncbi:MAG: transport-associated protein [Calothrix sp. C42_A2020_038]|nr:transport-associated protein [Calothrix sp. C42_A2020_038]